MKYLTLTLIGVVLSSVIFISCNTEKGKEDASEEIIVLDSIQKDTGIYEANTFDTVIVLEKKIVKKLRKRLPDYDKSMFNEVTVDFFFRLAEGTGGKAYFAESASKVKGVVLDILKNHVKSGTDVLFLIDKTGSMTDDIDKIRKSVDLFIDVLSSMENVRVGMAFYGDKNADDIWYDKYDLTENFDTLKQILNNIKVTGGGDTPESVNDGIFKSVQEYNWNLGNNKLIMVLGDAPSLKLPYSDHSESNVVSLCSKQGVKVNLYPVIIGFGFSSIIEEEEEDTELKDDYEPVEILSKKDITDKVPLETLDIKVYPNPVISTCAIEMKEWSKYQIEVFDMAGHKVMSKKIDDYQTRLDFLRQADGFYIISVYDKERNSRTEQKIIVQH